MPLAQLTPKHGAPPPKEEICLFAQTSFRNQARRFGIKVDDRRRHMYVIGKTGMGKTTIMENMVLSDIYSGHGVGVVDPHGDFAEKIINFIPPHRINDVVYLNPSDTNFPIGFNVLEVNNEEQKHLVSAGLMGIFKKIWPDVWSSRMEYILNNTLLALLDYPGSTLLGINRLLSDAAYRKKVVRSIKDPVVKAFWQVEFASYNDRYAQEAVAPIQNKIGQFLSTMLIRNMVAQVKSTINIREIMDSKKILIMNLSKGRIGEDNSRLLGGMLITKIQLAAMERVDTPEADRKDFFLYVDEFQNFASPSFANILSEARKYRLSLIMAHQYVAQLDEVVADAVFGNVGTIVTFRVGGADAELLVKEFTPVFTEEDIVNLPKYGILLKLMIDGVASQPFSANTMPPIGSPTGSSEKVIRVSRERYARARDVVEEKIIRWSGIEGGDEDGGEEDHEDEEVHVAPARPPERSREPRSQSSGITASKDQKSRPPRTDRPDRNTQSTERPVESKKEKTISLQELLPRDQTKKDTPQPQSPPAVPPAQHSVVPPVLAAQDVSSQAVPVPTSHPVIEHHPVPSQQTGNQLTNTVPGEKRKRKRKRKKKNRGDGVGGFDRTQSQPVIEKIDQPVVSLNTAPAQPKQVIEPVQHTPSAAPVAPPKTPPAPIAPNQIVQFD